MNSGSVTTQARSFRDLREICKRAQIVMLDNFAPDQIGEAVRRAAGKALVEVSGGITLDRIEALARAGVDVASVGGLTHSAPAADIGLDIERIG